MELWPMKQIKSDESFNILFRNSVTMSHVDTEDVEWVRMKWGLARRLVSNPTKAGALAPQTIMSRGLVFSELWVNPNTTKSVDVHVGPEEEEIYYVTDGKGYVVLNEKKIPVKPGSVVYIPPKTEHYVINTGDAPLHYFAPGYNIKVTKYRTVQKNGRIQLIHEEDK